MNNLLADLRSPTFSGHESFPFRHAWLKKGFDRIKDNPEFLSQDDALVLLGVGKNMVFSIRHWLQALQLVDLKDDRGSRLRLTPSDLGRAIFADPEPGKSEGGWDPYLEDPGTLWVLHYLLVTGMQRATTWWWAFHRPATVTFRKEQLVDELFACAQANRWRTTKNTLARDVDCFVRTYLPVDGKRDSTEDAISCPLTALGLIQPTQDANEYILNQGWQPSLPDGVFQWAMGRYLQHQPANTRSGASVSIANLLFDDGAPGRVFRLSEEALIDRLTRLSGDTGNRWVYDETAGLQQVLIRSPIDPMDQLEHHYRPKHLRMLVGGKRA